MNVTVFQEDYTFQLHIESSQRYSPKVCSMQTKLFGIVCGFRCNRSTIDRILSIHGFWRKRGNALRVVLLGLKYYRATMWVDLLY